MYGQHECIRQRPLEQSVLRRGLGQFPTGVTIVTTREPRTKAPIGLAVSSFNSLSLSPPLILWSIGLSSSSLGAFRAHDYFAVNILAEDQEDLCNIFARSGGDKFRGVEYDNGVSDVPLLRGAAAQFECKTVSRYAAGDHELYIGEVVSLSNAMKAPLVFHGGGFKRLSQMPAE
ncbi:flavin reductase family protein [Bradyrhizobium vignae]|uniref:flavin reductase family protein n=1 Tax=Bradyrhizobium vignae TaxID=1549949 RepID=UPI00100BDCCD|nr:flavin reductase [Bradyrhizobium vignae]